MAEALDVQQIHLPVKSKYNCLSLMSRTLQEVKQKQTNFHLADFHFFHFTTNLTESVVSTQLGAASLRGDAEERMGDARGPSGALRRPCKQGVIVLGRQWKNAIYTPYMLTYSLHKNNAQKAPANASVAVISNLLTPRESGRLYGFASMRSRSMTVGENENEEDQPLSAGQNEVESSWILSDESSLVPSRPQEWRPVNRRLSRSRWASRRLCTLGCPSTAKKTNKNSGLLSVGAVHIDIPQHPGVLHGMMTRGSKQLSSTLQEFRVPRMPSRNTGLNTSTIPDELDAVAGQIVGGDSGVFGANSAINNPAIALLPSPPKETPPAPEHRSSASGGGGKIVEREATANLLQPPLVMQFSIVLQRLSFYSYVLHGVPARRRVLSKAVARTSPVHQTRGDCNYRFKAEKDKPIASFVVQGFRASGNRQRRRVQRKPIFIRIHTYLLQLRDVDFPVRLRQYMKVRFIDHFLINALDNLCFFIVSRWPVVCHTCARQRLCNFQTLHHHEKRGKKRKKIPGCSF